jgi:tetratricopeptide (TPR) repeat protein
MRRPDLRLVAALAVTLAAPSAVAQSAQPAPGLTDEQRAEARAALSRGNDLFTRGNFEAALTEFQRVYELLASRPNRYVALLNIARCYERLFRYDQAVEYYQRFLSEAPQDDPDRAAATATAGALEGLLGTVEIQSNVREAQIWVDDRQVSEQVRAVRIPGGVHVIELRARGYAPARQQLSLPARTTRALEFRLERLNIRRGLNPAFFGVAAGFTVAGGIATGILGAQVLSIRAEVDRLRASPNRADQLMVGQDQKDQIRSFAIATDIVLSVTLVSAIGTTLLGIATEWRRPPEESAPRPAARALTPVIVAPMAASNTVGLSLGGSL